MSYIIFNTIDLLFCSNEQINIFYCLVRGVKLARIIEELKRIYIYESFKVNEKQNQSNQHVA